MRFVALIAGVVIGVAAAVAYAIVTDLDIREVFSRAQKDIEEIDIEQMQAQLQQSIAELHAKVEEALGQAKSANAEPSSNGAGDAEATAETVGVVSA
jgi:hypothetical protein